VESLAQQEYEEIGVHVPAVQQAVWPI
jgi:hypothetical protein